MGQQFMRVEEVAEILDVSTSYAYKVIRELNEELKRKGLSVPTEAKEENTINPLTAIANPRMIERVVKGAEFPLSLIYNAIDPDTVEEDLSLLADGLRLLQYDYIGGHGSRGYGRIAIRDLDIACVIGEIDEAVLERCKAVIGAI